MSGDRFDEARVLFQAALDVPQEQRAHFLEERCGEDAELRGEVDALLAHDAASGVFMQTPAAQQALGGQAWSEAADPSRSRGRIGHYEIRRVIASGGMGVVYEAEQDHPHRLVALKVLRHGVASQSALRRFQHEAEILGRLRHPNIAHVHEAGTFDEGAGAQPYFAMELIKGRPLIAFAESEKLSTRQRLQLFSRIGEAVHYAHQKGIIHRDLKPDNILVDEYGEPKVLDFGVARTTDSDIQVTTVQTGIGEFIGTVPYMSPEQVAGDPAALDTRSDVYSLGVVLYELLCGKLPHDLGDKSIPEAARIIREQDPTQLSSISRVFRGDLDTIVSKALDKDKQRRYQSAGELVADLRHHLNDEPIVARPASTFYQLRKFARRNRVLVGGIAGMFVLLAAGTAFSTIGFLRATSQAEKALLVSGFLEEMLASPNPYGGDRELTVVELIGDAAPTIDERFSSHPEIAARLKTTIGTTYRALGRLPEAEAALRSAYELSRQARGNDHPQTLDVLEELADTATLLHRSDSLDLAQELLDRRRLVHGELDRKTLQAVGAVASALSATLKTDDMANAERLLRKGLEQARRVHGDDDELTYHLNHTLSNTLMRQNKFAAAVPYARFSLAWCERRLDRVGDPKERAEWELQRSRAMTELAFNLGCTGDNANGAALSRRAAELQLERLGPASKTTRITLYGAGLNAQWAERLGEAESFFRKLLSAYQEPPAPREDQVALADFLLARVQLLQGELSPAEALPTIERATPLLVEWDPLMFGEMAQMAVALCLARLERYVDAERAADRIDGAFLDAISPDHHERRLYYQTLVEIYEGLGEPDRAAEYRALLREAEAIKASD